MDKEKFICGGGGFIWIDEVGAFCGIIDVLMTVYELPNRKRDIHSVKDKRRTKVF